MFYDRYKNRYIILTGDDDSDSGIWEADCDFQSVKPIVVGKQSFRACALLITKNRMYYVTDTPLETNAVYELIEHEHGASVNMLAEISGPCIYGCEKDETMYFATSVEGDPSQGKWKYRFSQRLGKGVKDRFIHIYKLDKSGIKEIGKFKKDSWPIWLFQFGNAQFTNSTDSEVYMYLQSSVTKGTLKLEDKYE